MAATEGARGLLSPSAALAGTHQPDLFGGSTVCVPLNTTTRTGIFDPGAKIDHRPPSKRAYRAKVRYFGSA